MANDELPSVWHDRIRLDDYDEFYKGIPERDLNHHDVTSPFDAWSIIKLRSRLHAQQIDKIPTDIMIWGRGEPKVPSGTKVGGTPVWPKDQPLPPAKKNVGIFDSGFFDSRLRFFAQFNFMDSLDLMPEIPAGLLSVWVNSDFPWHSKSIKCYWIDPNISIQVDEGATGIRAQGIPTTPFFAALFRTWDPAPNQEIEPVEVDHKFEAYRSYVPCCWHASKIGGLEAMPQSGSDPKDGQFIFQFGSIQAACNVPYPWINRREPLEMDSSENGIYNNENCLVVGDMGAISFCLKRNGRVTSTFECG